jgi:glycine betaine/choline ABC-type transport system substrate-binding protein
MTVLIDDKVMVPSNAAIALLASGIATPDLLAAIDTLNASLTTERLNQMLNEVVANGTDPTVVANAFMDSI